MSKYDGLELTYLCPAACPANVFVNVIYTLNEDVDGFTFTDGNYTERVAKENLWYIKMLFTPRGKTWEEVETLETKVIKK